MTNNLMTAAQASMTRELMNNPSAADADRQAFTQAMLSLNKKVLAHYAMHTPKPLLYQFALITPLAPVEVLCALAKSPHTDPSVLILLSLNTNPSVQAVVAENPRAPLEALRELAYVPATAEGDEMADAKFASIVALNNLNRQLATWEAHQPEKGTPVHG